MGKKTILKMIEKKRSLAVVRLNSGSIVQCNIIGVRVSVQPFVCMKFFLECLLFRQSFLSVCFNFDDEWCNAKTVSKTNIFAPSFYTSLIFSFFFFFIILLSCTFFSFFKNSFFGIQAALLT